VLDELLLSKLAAVEQRFEEISGKLADPAVMANRQSFQKMSKEHADLRDLVDAFRTYRDLGKRAVDAREMQKDPEMRDLAYEEERAITSEQAGLEERMKILLLPRDPNDDKNIMLEIRAGTGGEEAALFARDLYEMYRKYCELHRIKFEVNDFSESERGGFKECIINIKGSGAYRNLQYEGGGHRVQRVPETETQGRIHTSAATLRNVRICV